MKKILKFIVIFFGILIIVLLSITIITIFKKFDNNQSNFSNKIILNIIDKGNYEIKNFQINKKQLHLLLENKDDNIQLIRTYNLKSGKISSEIIIK
tara:strand:- start:1015 stop:1302 length:288 start_codon:yes stop_codon:yes gene_type:complete